jgi:hypothetical protein
MAAGIGLGAVAAALQDGKHRPLPVNLPGRVDGDTAATLEDQVVRTASHTSL